MSAQELLLLISGIISSILSFVGVVLGLTAQASVQRALKKKTTAEAREIDASAANKLVDAALTIKDNAMELNEPLRLALENERKIYREALAQERKERKEELESERNKRLALELIVNQNSKELTELRADYEWLYEGATVLTHQLKSQKIEPLFNLNEKRK